MADNRKEATCWSRYKCNEKTDNMRGGGRRRGGGGGRRRGGRQQRRGWTTSGGGLGFYFLCLTLMLCFPSCLTSDASLPPRPRIPLSSHAISTSEVRHHDCQLGVENKDWDLAYCDHTSDLYLELLREMQELFQVAAEEGGVGAEFQQFTNMEVWDPTQSDTCQSTRYLRSTQGGDVVVTGEVELLQTENYDSDINATLVEALEKVIQDEEIMSEIGLEVTPGSVKLEGPSAKLCGQEMFCANTTAVCTNEMNSELNVLEGRCACRSGLVDKSPSPDMLPGELCVQSCVDSFCANSGQCQMSPQDYKLYCSCVNWYTTGKKCTTDLRGVIGGVVAFVVVMVVLAAGLVYKWRAQKRPAASDDPTSSASDSGVAEGADDNRSLRLAPDVRVNSEPAGGDPWATSSVAFRGHLARAAWDPSFIDARNPAFLTNLDSPSIAPWGPLSVAPREPSSSPGLHSQEPRMVSALPQPEDNIWAVSRNLPRPHLTHSTNF